MEKSTGVLPLVFFFRSLSPFSSLYRCLLVPVSFSYLSDVSQVRASYRSSIVLSKEETGRAKRRRGLRKRGERARKAGGLPVSERARDACNRG